MKKTAMLLATGYEEGEALFVVDIMRRASIKCDIVSTENTEYVEGSHGIIVKTDRLLDNDIKAYDMIILPGGAGAARLRDNPEVINLVRYFDAENKYIAAICAAPMILHQAGITKGRTLTSYPGEKYEKLFENANYSDELVVSDGNLITSRGPATTLAFAYALVDALGGDSQALKQAMLYNMLMESR